MRRRQMRLHVVDWSDCMLSIGSPSCDDGCRIAGTGVNVEIDGPASLRFCLCFHNLWSAIPDSCVVATLIYGLSSMVHS